MSIPTISQTNSAKTSQVKTTPSDAAKASLDYNSFLKLMLQQLKSQDPTNPVDQTQTLAQLASFSNVEQSIKLNTKLDTLLQQTGMTNAVGLIGKQVTSSISGMSGTVASVEANSSGIFAVLADGEKISTADGLRISG